MHAPSRTAVSTAAIGLRTSDLLVWLAVASGAIVLFEPAPYDVLLIGAVAAGAGSAIRLPRRAFAPAVLLGFFLLANGVSAISAAMDARANQAVYRVLWYLGVTAYLAISWLVFVAVLDRKGARGAHWLLRAYTLGAVATAAAGILAYVGVLPFGDQLLRLGRVKGLFKDPNVFGPFLVPVAVYALERLERGRRRWLWIGASLILFCGVALSFSRAAWGNYTAAIILYLGLRLTAGEHGTGRILLGLAAATVCAAFAVDWIATQTEALELARQRFGLQEYDRGRFETQRAALGVALQSPLGIGPGLAEWFLPQSTHNVYLRVLIENGVPGLAGFAALLVLSIGRAVYGSFRGGAAARPLFRVLTAALAGQMLNSFVIDSLHWRHLWLLVALTWLPLGASAGRGRSGRRTAVRARR